MKFAYKVMDAAGAIAQGTMEGDNRQAVAGRLLGQGYYILQLTEAKGSREVNFDMLRPSRVQARDLAAYTRQLGTMLGAGLPIVKCFDILSQQKGNKKLVKTSYIIKSDLEGGSSLWEALDKHPKVFSKMYVSMVKAGELGGIMDDVLFRLAEHLEREKEINSKVRSASIYPIIVMVLAVTMVTIILTFVMPTFIDMFKSAGAELPGPTRVLMAVSGFLRSQGLLLLAALIALVLGLKWVGRKPAGRMFFDRLYMKLPVIGPTIMRIAATRFTRTMGTLLAAGIPVMAALEVVEGAVGNAPMAQAIGEARESISKGEAMSVPLAASGVFEPMVTQMIEVGEQTGMVDTMLQRMSDYYDREIVYLVESLMAFVEPVLLIVVALLVGGIIVATLLPIFNMANLVGAGA